MPNQLSTLSRRGQSLASNPARIDFELFAEASQNLYCPDNNPDGAFPLNIAENTVSTAIIKDKLTSITNSSVIPEWVMKYTDLKGNPEVRETIAFFLERHLCKCQIDPNSIALSAGASAVIEVSSYLLANPDDVVVIPSPSYPMYTNDMGIKNKIERYDLATHFFLNEIGSTAPVNISMLQKAKEELDASNRCFKILLITTPDNPTGCIYSEHQLDQISDWCLKNEVHMVVNEIYGLSLIDTENDIIKDDYQENTDFVSFANIMSKKKSPYLHMWYAFSKDFAMSGLRFGVVHSLNETFLKGYENVNVPHLVSNHTQWMIAEMLKDDAFITSYIEENKKGLNESYLVVIDLLKRLNIPYIPSRGSLFIWADLSKYMIHYSDQGQEKLWLDIYKYTGVLLTPGMGFRHLRKGMFRVVFTAVPSDYLKVAMHRLEGYLTGIHK